MHSTLPADTWTVNIDNTVLPRLLSSLSDRYTASEPVSIIWYYRNNWNRCCIYIFCAVWYRMFSALQHTMIFQHGGYFDILQRHNIPTLLYCKLQTANSELCSSVHRRNMFNFSNLVLFYWLVCTRSNFAAGTLHTWAQPLNNLLPNHTCDRT